jgi:hypothetical protein
MAASKGSTDITPGTFTTTGEAGIVPVTEALQKVWTRLQKDHPTLPAVTIVVKRDGRAWGHTTLAKVWGAQAVKGRGKAKAATLKDERLEVMISGENLSRGAVDVLGTLLHEATHVLNITDGIQDCDSNGRHSKGKFAKRAEQVFGLEIKDLGNYLGWTDTYVPEATQARYATEIKMLERALGKSTVAHHGVKVGGVIVPPTKPAPGKTKTGGRAKNLSRAVCGCQPDATGWRPSLRASAKVLAIGIKCEECGDLFQVTGE